MTVAKEAKQKFTPTSTGKWPSGPVELDLPSGAKVRARKPNIFVWLKTGQIPDDILATIVATAKGEEDVSLLDRQTAVAWMIAKCMVEPEISLVPRENCTCVDEIDDLDKEYLMLSLGISLG